MRQLILQVSAMSVDGYITAEGTEAERLVDVADDVRDEWMVAALRTAGVHIMGRITYESMAAHWPTSTEVFAEPMNSIPKVVFSRSLQETQWADSSIASGDTREELLKLKEQPGGDILAHGEIHFAQSLADSGSWMSTAWSSILTSRSREVPSSQVHRGRNVSSSSVPRCFHPDPSDPSTALRSSGTTGETK